MKFIRIPTYKLLLAAGDFFSMVIGLIVVSWDSSFRENIGNITTLLEFVLSFLLLAFIWGFIMHYHNFYKVQVIFSRASQIVLIFKTASYALLGYLIIWFFLQPYPWIAKRSSVFFLFLITSIMLILWRTIIFPILWSKGFKKGNNKRRTVVIGSSRETLDVATNLHFSDSSGCKIVGIITEGQNGKLKNKSGFEIVGVLSELPTIIKEKEIDNVILASNRLTPAEIIGYVEQCSAMGKEVAVASAVYDVVLKNWEVEEHNGVPLIRMMGARSNRLILIAKRISDILLVSVGLLLLSPLLLLIALFIKLDSSGPVLYKQKRIGKNGKVFNFYKFRTMIVEKEKSDEENRRVQYRDFINGKKEATKIVDEARVTRIGKILRKMSIDELPQLWNVLIGDMSLIGPRPCLPYEWESYSEWHKKRLSVTPGCSGLWQVSDRKTISFEEMVLLDFYYIENISPWMDLQIILKTIPVMFFGQGGKWE